MQEYNSQSFSLPQCLCSFISYQLKEISTDFPHPHCSPNFPLDFKRCFSIIEIHKRRKPLQLKIAKKIATLLLTDQDRHNHNEISVFGPPLFANIFLDGAYPAIIELCCGSRMNLQAVVDLSVCFEASLKCFSINAIAVVLRDFLFRFYATTVKGIQI